MASASSESGFSAALRDFHESKPPGYEHLLPHLDTLAEAFFAALRDYERSEFFVDAEQFRAPHVYQALERLAALSKAEGRFRLPCCSDYPLIWPLCDTDC